MALLTDPAADVTIFSGEAQFPSIATTTSNFSLTTAGNHSMLYDYEAGSGNGGGGSSSQEYWSTS